MNNELIIGGVLATDLAKRFGTPLYVMDESKIRAAARRFKKCFSFEGLETEVIYASKAFLNKAMAQLVHEEGLSLDVVSGGELYTAHKAKFPMERVYFHGNNKSDEELIMAMELGVGTIVLDHPEEGERLIGLLKERGQRQGVMVRVNPGVEAHTHEYIQTTLNNSKFGVSLYSAETMEWLKSLKDESHIELKGLHAHIGSQIFDGESFIKSTDLLIDYLVKARDEGILLSGLNMGGGFGVWYTKEDRPIELEPFFEKWLNHIKNRLMDHHLQKTKLMIEPGRAIVAEAGTTLYTVGGTKETYGGKKFVFVDGSMADHIRTALYGAKYTAVLASSLCDGPMEAYTVSGKACESGDVIVHFAYLPRPQRGDVLAVLSTGAYHYSMSSNYNRLPRPAVVFASSGKAKVVVKRETYADIIRNDEEI